MSSVTFNFTENPLAHGFGTPGGSWGNLKADGSSARNASASDTDAVETVSGSSATESEAVIAATGGADGGPCLIDSSGNGYVCTRYDGTNLRVFRVDAPLSYNDISSSLGAANYGAGKTIKLRISGNFIIASEDGVDITTSSSDTTYRSGLKPGIFCFSADLTWASWTDNVAGSVTPVRYFQNNVLIPN